MDDSPWDDGDENYTGVRDTEWSKISSEFTNAGYREGITAGKEAALQEGFDSGFADIGVPLGREVGMARGMTAALVALLGTRARGCSEKMEMEVEVGEIQKKLNEVRFSDIAPRDIEAEEHAREHLEEEMIDVNEELAEKREMEKLEDMLGALGQNIQPRRPRLEDVRALERRVDELVSHLTGEAVLLIAGDHV